MATAAVVQRSRNVYTVDWVWAASATGVSNTISLGAYVEMQAQFAGPTGGTSSIKLEGRVSPTTTDWFTLESVSGLAMSFTDAEPTVSYVIRNHPFDVRARASTITGGASIAPEVRLLIRTDRDG